MKNFTCCLILASVLNPFTPFRPADAVAQQAQETKTLEQLREEVATLEAAERDPAATPDILELNRKFLADRKDRLRSALLKRRNALSHYLTNVTASLDPREIQVVKNSIVALEDELRQLGVQPPAPIPTATPRVESQLTRTAFDPISETTAAARRAASQKGTNLAVPAACQLKPPINPDVDFVIDAYRSGEPGGKTRFRLSDRARIILNNKNPFLYQYRVTLQATVIEEPAVGSFLSMVLPSGLTPPAAAPPETSALTPSDTSPGGGLNKTDSGKLFTNLNSSSCAGFKEQLDDLQKRSNELIELKGQIDTKFKNAGEFTAEYARQDEALKDQSRTLGKDGECEGIYNTATTLQSQLEFFLQKFEGDFDRLSGGEWGNQIRNFQSQSQSFQQRLDYLGSLSDQCRDNADFTTLKKHADDYAKAARSFADQSKELNEGREKMTKTVQNIRTVLAQPNPFYEVYYRGDYDLPTDIQVKVERKSLATDNAPYTTLMDNQRLNFGGRARFALAGGLVGSPFETFNFVRIPTSVDGKTIVGVNRSSSSRILPMLMLHGRVYSLPCYRKSQDGKASYGKSSDGKMRRCGFSEFLDGIHLSLGVTAKPNDEGTNVEYLVGPSFSFLEGRMFVTVGGYGGRTQRLEGNFTQGAEIPESFTGELPVSQRFVWKPGFSLTYKIK